MKIHLQPGPSAPPSDLLRSLTPPEANPATAKPDTQMFPWPEMRDFVSTMVSGMMAQQNLMVGQQMVAANNPNATQEQVDTLQALVTKLDDQLKQINQTIEQRLGEFEGKRPRLIRI